MLPGNRRGSSTQSNLDNRELRSRTGDRTPSRKDQQISSKSDKQGNVPQSENHTRLKTYQQASSNRIGNSTPRRSSHPVPSNTDNSGHRRQVEDNLRRRTNQGAPTFHPISKKPGVFESSPISDRTHRTHQTTSVRSNTNPRVYRPPSGESTRAVVDYRGGSDVRQQGSESESKSEYFTASEGSVTGDADDATPMLSRPKVEDWEMYAR